MPSSGESELARVNRALQSKYGEVLELRGVYQGITAECEEIKIRMARRVHQINAINDCLDKKNYFLELKRQTSQYIHSDHDQANHLQDSKRELAYLLKSIAPQ